LLEDKNRYSAAIDEWRQRIAEADEKQAQLAKRAAGLAEQLAERGAELQRTQEMLAAERLEHAAVQARLDAQKVLTRAHEHHERQLHGVASGLHGALTMASDDTVKLHERIARLVSQETVHVRLAKDTAQQASADGERAAKLAKEQFDAAARHARELLEYLQQRLGSVFDQAVRSQITMLRDTLNARVNEIAENARSGAENSKQPAEEVLRAIAMLVDELEAGARQAREACDRACEEFSQALHSHGEQQRSEQMEYLAGVRKTLEAHVGRLAELQQELGERRAQEAKELAAAARMLDDRHAEEIAKLSQQVAELRSREETSDRELVDYVAKALADRRVRHTAASEELVAGAQRVAQSSSAAHGQVLERLQAASDDAGNTLGEGAADARKAFDSVTQATMKLIDDSKARASELTQGLQVHHSSVRQAAEGVAEGAGRAQQRVRKHAEEAHTHITGMAELVHSVVGELGAAGTQAAQQVEVVTGGALEEVQGSLVEVEGRVRVQGDELQSMAGRANEGIQQISEHVRQSAAGVTPTPDDGSTPQPRVYEACESWQVTRDHAYILEHLDTQSAEQLSWTGVTVSPSNPLASSQDASSFSLTGDEASDDMHVVSDTPVSAASVQTLVGMQPGQLHEALDGVAKLMRKRPSSDGAGEMVAELLEEEAGRPARRPRTGETRVSGASQENVDVEAENASSQVKMPPSAIPLPNSSRLPSRKSRRTRG
ncbi:hypothetical protein LPJ73_000905, partial [Coemansia sp. RSA 2703]